MKRGYLNPMIALRAMLSGGNLGRLFPGNVENFTGIGPAAIGNRRGPIPLGTSRRTVAQDRRAAKKRRAVKRARRLGHA